MWHVMWLQCHVPLHHPKEKKKKIKIVQSKAFHNKKKKLEYIQRLWDKVLEEEAALLEGAEGF